MVRKRVELSIQSGEYQVAVGNEDDQNDLECSILVWNCSSPKEAMQKARRFIDWLKQQDISDD